MKKMLLLMGVMLAIVISLASLAAASNFNEAGKNPADAVVRYIEAVRDGRFDEAYLLTDQHFQSIIPRDVFVNFHEKLNCPGILSYELDNVTAKDAMHAEVDILFKESYSDVDAAQSSEAVLKLIKEADEWRVCLDWEPYYPLKVDLLPPIAQVNYDGVRFILKYILLYPSFENVAGYTNIRLDIDNSSCRYVEWQLPMPGTADGYLEDLDSGRIFYPSYAYGILAKKNQDYQFIPWKDNLGTMLIGPDAKVTLYIQIEGLIPDTTKELNVFLSGLSFCDYREPWNVVIDHILFSPETVPVGR